VKELNEMTIGRTDDPENPFGAQAFQSRPSVWDWIADPIWASGHEPRRQAVHMIAVDPPVRILTLLLHPRGRSLIASLLSIDSCLLESVWMPFISQREEDPISQDCKGTMVRRRHVKPPFDADRRGQAPKPRSGASQTPGLRLAISIETMRTAVLPSFQISPSLRSR
jgi:hypothetical protein